MNKGIASTLLVMSIMGCTHPQQSAPVSAKSGEQLFSDRCSTCHPNGRNIINPQKTLFKIDREAQGVRTPDDVIRTMRNPGPGMPRYTPDLISDGDARKIAEFVIATFN